MFSADLLMCSQEQRFAFHPKNCVLRRLCQAAPSNTEDGMVPSAIDPRVFPVGLDLEVYAPQI